MKTYLIYVTLLLCTLSAIGQSCPQSTVVNGQQFPVEHFGNQCFYIDNTDQYMTEKLNELIGFFIPLTHVISFTSLTSTINSVNLKDYQYQYGPISSSCTVTETIVTNVDLGLEISGTHPHTGSIVFNGQVSAVIVIERRPTIITDIAGTTFVNTFLSVTFSESHITIDHPLLNDFHFPDPRLIIKNDVLEDIQVFLSVLRPLQKSFMHKLNNETISFDTEITGSTTLCDQPITLSLTNGYNGSWSSGGAPSNSISVSSPGTYSVVASDMYCNKKLLSTTVTQAPEIPAEFIAIEPLCSGKIKLTADGFEEVNWSTVANTSSIEVNQTGIYSAEATNQHGCKGTDQVKLTFGASCQPTGSPIAALNVAAICSDFPNLLRRWKITNPNSTPIRMDWEISGTIQKTWLDVPPGDSYLSSITVPLNQNLLKVYWHDEKGQIKSLQQASTTSRCQKGASSSSIASSGRFESELKVFPNPAKDQFILEIASDDERTVPLQILSASGVVWYTGTIQLSKGQNFISNDISRFDNGAYVIKLGSETIRFMKE